MPGTAFTSAYKGLSNVLKNKVKIRAYANDAFAKEYNALWDTGSTNSSIKESLVRELGLRPVAYGQSRTMHGVYNTPCYYIDVELPNHVIIEKLLVLKGNSPDWDILIGMDVIAKGDFAISNYQGNTVFTFRCPSCMTFDFVKNYYSPKDRVERITGANCAKKHRPKKIMER